MKTQEMFTTLRAFAGLAEVGPAEELRRFAGAFSGGKQEAVAARVKRVLARWKADPPPQGHPASLKRALVAIEAGLSASGAKKQASDLQVVLSLFDGPGTATVDSFVAQITTVLVAAPSAKPRTSRAHVPDDVLADELAAELARTVLDESAFAKVVDRLRDAKRISTPTLATVANRFLGNSKTYKGRKSAIDDIVSRQKMDAWSHARNKALDRLGV